MHRHPTAFVTALALVAGAAAGCTGERTSPAMGSPPAPYRPEARVAPPPVRGGTTSSAVRGPVAAPAGPTPSYASPSPVATAPYASPSTPAPAASYGGFAWSRSLADAQAAARASGRLIFVEEGRPACGNCMLLKDRIIPQPDVSADLGSVAVGFYDDVDANPGSVSFQILRSNLPDALTLPLCGFLTPDLRWVHGYWGGRDAARFRAEIATARARARAFATAPVPAPAPAVAPARDVHLAGAAPAPSGFATEDERRAWARDRLDRAADALTALDFGRARTILAEVREKGAGLPEEREAQKGEIAIHNLARIEHTASSDEASRLRDLAREDLAGTRWAHLFP